MRKKVIRTALALSCVLASGTAVANPKAIWDTYPILLCKYDTTMLCETDMSRCSTGKGEAVMRFDFAKNQMHSFVSKEAQTIVGRYHFDSEYYELNTVLVDGQMYSFLPPKKGPLPSTTDLVEGVAQGASAYGAFNAHMTCHPD